MKKSKIVVLALLVSLSLPAHAGSLVAKLCENAKSALCAVTLKRSEQIYRAEKLLEWRLRKSRYPDNQLPMYGYLHDLEPTNDAERKFLKNIKRIDKAFIDEILSQGYTRKSGSRAVVKRGWDYDRKNDQATAMMRFNQGWLLDPENGDSYHGFAVMLAKRGDEPEDIERYFLKALLKPNVSVVAHVDYGRFLWMQKRLDQAMKVLHGALEIEPKAYLARAHIAFIHYLRRDAKKACHWAKLAEKNGDDLEKGFRENMCEVAASE